ATVPRRNPPQAACARGPLSQPGSSGTRWSRCGMTGFGSAALHEQADSGPLLTVDRDVDEGGYANEVEPAGRHVAAGDGDGLDGLVDGARADRLDLDAALASDHTGNRSCHGDWLGGG